MPKHVEEEKPEIIEEQKISSIKTQKEKTEEEDTSLSAIKNKYGLPEKNALSSTARFADISMFNYESSKVYSPKKHDVLGRQFNIIGNKNIPTEKPSKPHALKVYDDYKKTREVSSLLSNNVGSLSQFMIDQQSANQNKNMQYNRKNNGSKQIC